MVELRSGRGCQDSYFHVFAVGEQFVKVRITATQGEVTVEEARSFVRALLTGMRERAESESVNARPGVAAFDVLRKVALR